jgi:FkbM family methyltransferase
MDSRMDISGSKLDQPEETYKARLPQNGLNNDIILRFLENNVTKIKHSIKSATRAVLRKAGFDVVNLKHNERFGWDWMRDVGRLAPLIGSKIDMVFDVGANSGCTALELRRHFPDARIHCFEPVPATYKLLAHTVAANPRISTHAIALGPKNGPATMQCFDSSLLNSCAPNPPFNVRFPQTSTCIEVTMRRIDDYCGEHAIDRISLLKVDAEGFDLQILRGATQMLNDGRVDFVFAEFNGAAPQEAETGSNLSSIAEMLYPAGFRFVSSYTDGVAKSLPLYVMSNALFVRVCPACEEVRAAPHAASDA